MSAVVSDGFPDLLRNGSWHTTRPDRFASILRCGEIIANPDIPDAERWKTNCGTDYYPYVRHIGGISLFEFNNFDPVAYSETCPMSSWRTFVPVHSGWPASVWLKIDPTQVNGQYLTPRALAERQCAENAQRHTLMPRIEAAVVGSIPLDAVTAHYIVNEGSATLRNFKFNANVSRPNNAINTGERWAGNN